MKSNSKENSSTNWQFDSPKTGANKAKFKSNARQNNPLNSCPPQNEQFPFDLTRFQVLPNVGLFRSMDQLLGDHINHILHNCINSENFFNIGVELTQMKRELFQNHIGPIIFFLFFNSNSEISLESILLSTFLFFKHNYSYSSDRTLIDLEQFVAYLMIAVKIQEINQPNVECILGIIYKYVYNTNMDLDALFLEKIKQTVYEKEGNALRDLQFRIAVPPFFFYLDYLNELEGNAPRSSGKYDWPFFNMFLKHPEKLFGQENGLRLSVLELVEEVRIIESKNHWILAIIWKS